MRNNQKILKNLLLPVNGEGISEKKGFSCGIFDIAGWEVLNYAVPCV
jgi:hypothetical protein